MGSCHVEPLLDRRCDRCESVASGGKQFRWVIHASNFQENRAQLYRVSLLLAVVGRPHRFGTAFCRVVFNGILPPFDALGESRSVRKKPGSTTVILMPNCS